MSPLEINPAQAGAYRNFIAIASYKTQWTSVSGNGYKTILFSSDMRILQKKWKDRWLATGLNICQDKAGDGNMGTFQVSISPGYHTRINERNVLGAALLAGFGQRSIDHARLTWDNQWVYDGEYDPGAPSGEPAGNKFNYPDFGFGVLHQYNKGQMYSSANDMFVIHSGLAVFHLNKPAYSFYGTDERLHTKFSGHVEAIVGIKNTKLAILPGIIYTRQNPSSELLSGCHFRYMLSEDSKFTGFIKAAYVMAGVNLRLKDAIIPSVQLEFGQYTVGISYDVNLSGLKSASGGRGGFEIALRYGIPSPFFYSNAASFE